SVALVIVKSLPPWTAWVVLAFLVVWDLIAVLCPFGPLRLLIDMSKDRNENIQLKTNFKKPNYSIEKPQTNNSTPETESYSESSRDDEFFENFEENVARIQLGLGDFIFYSVLMGKVLV
ncbi:hypothetical protein B4U80_05381, partial [Leptotrombidium deliense]